MRLIFVFLFSVGIISQVHAEDLSLLPAKLNELLPKIEAGMAVREVEGILATSYPGIKGIPGLWSGQSGYVDFKLNDRYKVSISFSGNETPTIPANVSYSLFDNAKKLRFDIRQFSWDEGGTPQRFPAGERNG